MTRTALLLVLALAHAQNLVSSDDEWNKWECPGFPCFITNQYDPKNTTASRIETCGPIASLTDCQVRHSLVVY